MSLQPEDLAFAYAAAWRCRQYGDWERERVSEDIGLSDPMAQASVARLREASIVRDRSINLIALSELLPTLRYLAPLHEQRQERVRGLPTGYASPALGHQIRYEVPQVWKSSRGDAIGIPVTPLYENLPSKLGEKTGLYDVFTLLDAVRTGRAREVRLATEKLRPLLGLPNPHWGAALEG